MMIEYFQMYCTGGIRCERATALLNQMSTVNEELKPKGVYHCRGGIERYVKTFPNGGYWNGKNYLFDKRFEQVPDIKDGGEVENDIHARCCLCQTKWTVYRGQFKCSRSFCGVPVIVCQSCTTSATERPATLVCELCKEGYRAPNQVPDLVAMKRKAEQIIGDGPATNDPTQPIVSKKQQLLAKRPKVYYNDRLFLRRVPLTASFTKIKGALGANKVKCLVWLTDKESGGFYGSCVVLTSSAADMKQILEKSTSKLGIKIDKKRIKVAEMFRKEDEDKSPFTNLVQKEFPPIGK